MLDLHLALLAAALIVDALAGDPAGLWRRVAHPVALIGVVIDRLDRSLNHPADPPARQKLMGFVALGVAVAIAAAAGFALEWALAHIPFGAAGTIIAAAILMAGRSLYDHVRAVARAFATGGLMAARAAVAHIVGRDPASLDEAGICRAAIESTAESFCDGVVAPALWFVLLGLPGLAAYKVVNTADSMIGHHTERYEHFGFAAARTDDFANWPAARIAGVLIALAAPLAGGSPLVALRVMLRDAAKHRSPNAGWSEAAMAGALGLALNGPRSYGGEIVVDPFVNAEGRQAATPSDIWRGLRVYVGAGALLFLIVAGLALALS